jgi:hypothetical protein
MDGVLEEEAYRRLTQAQGTLTHGEAYALLASVLKPMLKN